MKLSVLWKNEDSYYNELKGIIFCSVYCFSSVQLLSHVQLSVTPWTANTSGFPVHHQLLELAQMHVHRVGDAIQPSHPRYPLLLPSIFYSLPLIN